MTKGPVCVQAHADPPPLTRHKQPFYPAAWASYQLAVPGSLLVAPHEHRLAALRLDYINMRAMIFGQTPRFEALLRPLAELEAPFNQSSGRG